MTESRIKHRKRLPPFSPLSVRLNTTKPISRVPVSFKGGINVIFRKVSLSATPGVLSVMSLMNLVLLSMKLVVQVMKLVLLLMKLVVLLMKLAVLVMKLVALLMKPVALSMTLVVVLMKLVVLSISLNIFS